MLEPDDPRTNVIYEAPKGSKFKIKAGGNLYHIEMVNGGVRPEITEKRFTSFKRAENALMVYFEQNPKPVERVKTKKTED